MVRNLCVEEITAPGPAANAQADCIGLMPIAMTRSGFRQREDRWIDSVTALQPNKVVNAPKVRKPMGTTNIDLQVRQQRPSSFRPGCNQDSGRFGEL